jgi:thiol-disulfide isomerase/thioredoxin
LPRLLDLLLVFLVFALLFRLFVAPRMLGPASVQAMPFTLPVVGGSEFRLSRHRGRVVFLEFSTSWCDACKALLPLVERYAKAHPDVDVLTVDTGEPAQIAAQFAREAGLKPLAVDADQSVRLAFGVTGYPTMVVIDPKGFIRAKWFGYNPAIESVMENARTALKRR